jgi:alpha-amylase
MSSYWWYDGTAGADSNPAPTALVYDNGEPLGCNDTDWVCEHRRPAITAMVKFRQVTSGGALSDWETISPNQIAFGRGARGFVAINNEEAALENHTFQTSMPAGDYCDVITGGLSEDGSSCVGLIITVDENGQISNATILPIGAFAIHSESLMN